MSKSQRFFRPNGGIRIARLLTRAHRLLNRLALIVFSSTSGPVETIPCEIKVPFRATELIRPACKSRVCGRACEAMKEVMSAKG